MHIYFPNVKNNYNPVYKSIFGKKIIQLLEFWVNFVQV